MELLGELQESSLSVLVFSQWTELLDAAEALMDSSWPVLRIDGSTSQEERALRVQKFQASSGVIMLLSLKAGGVGLTLTAAHHVIFLDPWWNPAWQQQAMDRVHRIGQTHPVMIHHLIAKDTLEHRVLSLQSSKKDLLLALTPAWDLWETCL
jgi:SNF2 family DNA or RNA helicase